MVSRTAPGAQGVYRPDNTTPPCNETATTIRVAGYAVAAFALFALSAPSNLIVAGLVVVVTELIIDDSYPWISQAFSKMPSTPRSYSHTIYNIHANRWGANDPFDGYVPRETTYRQPWHAENDRRYPVGTESPEPQWHDVSPMTRRRTPDTGTVFSSTPRRADDDDDRRDPVGSGDAGQRYWASDTSVGTPSVIQQTPRAEEDRRDLVGAGDTDTPSGWNLWSAFSPAAATPTAGPVFRERDPVGEE